MARLRAAYRPSTAGALDLDRAFYERIATSTEARRLRQRLVVPIRSGQAWEVPAGHVFRIVTIDGPQVGDLNIWNRHDPREHLWAARTRQLQRAHVSTHDRLWSTLPRLRPMTTITHDTLAGYGTDDDGGRLHDLLGTRCDPYANQMLTGESFDFHCHSNLVRAVLPYGLSEYDVHDVLNVFQCTGLDDDRYFMKACPARPGDFLELFAEIDLLCALSTCPGGDLSRELWGRAGSDAEATCHPIGVEIYELDPSLLDGWQSPEPAAYNGLHGVTLPQWRGDGGPKASNTSAIKANLA